VLIVGWDKEEITLEDILPIRIDPLKDLAPSVFSYTSPKEPAVQLQETALIDSSDTDVDDKVQIDYFIIVGSFRTLIQAQ